MAKAKEETIDTDDIIIPVKAAKLHAPLFMGGFDGKTSGKNLGDTIVASDQLFLSYNLTRRLLYIEYNGNFAFADTAATIQPLYPQDVGYKLKGKPVKQTLITNVTHPHVMGSSKSAQVADPTGVFKPLVK